MVIFEDGDKFNGTGDWHYTPTRTVVGAGLKEMAGQKMPDPVVAHRNVPQVGRNEPCPCGSRKKSKRCCV